MSKAMMMILLERLRHGVEPFLAEEQANFISDRISVQQMLTLRLIEETAIRKGQSID